MPRQQKLPEEKQKAHASKVVVALRVEEISRIRLDGAEFWDVCEFAREKEGEGGSAWSLSPNDKPMSDANLRCYVAKADAIIEASTARNRKKLIRQHTAKRRDLYVKAVLSADYRSALSCLRDEADLLGLYPNAKHVVTVTKRASEQGELLPLARLGEILAPFPDAKVAVGAYLEQKMAEARRERPEGKSG